MKFLSIILVTVSASMFFSCNQPGKEKTTESKVDHVMSEQKAGDGFTACQHASKIYWTGTKPTGEHNGIIKLNEGGNFKVEDNKVVGGSFVIDMNSIVNIDVENPEMNEKLVGHLKSEDFFAVDSFPTAMFVITGLSDIEEEEFNTLVKGELTIKGISNEVEFKAKLQVNDGAVSAMSEEIVLDRTKWGITYKSKSIFKELKDKFINDDFSIKIEAYSM